MKKIFSLSISMLILISMGCKKKSDQEIEISTDQLTTCAANMNCTYLYYDHADFGEPNFLTFKKGNYKIFKYSAVSGNGYYAKHILIRVPLNIAKFTLNNEEVLAGAVRFGNPCPSCDQVGLKITGGNFKGVKVSGSASKPKWLVDGKVYLNTVHPSSFKDTINIKQYFTADSLRT